MARITKEGPSPKKTKHARDKPIALYPDWSDSEEDIEPGLIGSSDPLDLEICAKEDEGRRVVRSVVVTTPGYLPITQEDRDIERKCNEMIAGTGLSPL